MNDPNRLGKWLFVILLVVLALATLYPPQEKLKGGIDLVAVSSMLLSTGNLTCDSLLIKLGHKMS